MNGKEHYERSEQLLANLADVKIAEQMQKVPVHVLSIILTNTMLEAQVHATLALTMATLVGMEKSDWGD